MGEELAYSYRGLDETITDINYTWGENHCKTFLIQDFGIASAKRNADVT